MSIRVLIQERQFASKVVAWAFTPPAYASPSKNALLLPLGTRLPFLFLWLFSEVGPLAADPLTWHQQENHRYVEVTPKGADQAGFTRLSFEETGVAFTNRLAESRHLFNQIPLNGSGVAAGDVDGDGWCDLYFCGLDGPNRYFRNLGDWQFEDVTEVAGVACEGRESSGAAFADLDGDRDLDLVVNSVGQGTLLWFNDGHGRFTSSALINPRRCGTSLGLADQDGDGDLDLYLANYRTDTIRDRPNTRFSFSMISGQPVLTRIDGSPLTDPMWTNRFQVQTVLGPGGRGSFSYQEHGEPDLFLENLGDGRFRSVPFTGGRFLDESGRRLQEGIFDWGLSVFFRDLNGDRLPDLYLCNDFKTPDRIWLGTTGGRFRALEPIAIRQTCISSMALDVADINRDGFDDIFVADMLSLDNRRRLVQRNDLRPDMPVVGEIKNRPQYARNMLFLNRGDGTYAEIAQYAGLEASEWTWAPIFLDVDLDGFEDLLVFNGFERDNMNLDALDQIMHARATRKLSTTEELELRRFFPRLDTANLAFRNQGDLRFQEVGRLWGLDDTTISQGVCLADLDNDGDLDLAVNNLNARAALYRNNSPAPRVAVRLKGLPPNTHGVGARIVVRGGPVPLQSQQIVCGGRYLSSDDSIRAFAAPSPDDSLEIEVQWRSGRRTHLKAKPNRLYEIEETATQPMPEADPEPGPFFEEIASFHHHHHETDFNDFSRQPTLPKRLSQLGPAACWSDFNGDGWDDLAIGTGAGGRLALFQNNQKGELKPWPLDSPIAAPRSDVAGIVSGGGDQLLVASAGYEQGTEDAAIRQYHLGAPSPVEALAGWNESLGPLSLADVDDDGDLDLFVGGRVVPARFPESASSHLYRRDAERWHLDKDNTALLRNIGMVSGSTFTDLNGDAAPDLVLACEWGPLRVFRNDGGRLDEWDPPVQMAGDSDSKRRWTLSQLIGWWNGVAAGDFDGDGRMDLVASNWGRNTRFESRRMRPIRLYHADLDRDGSVELVEAAFDPVTGLYLPERRLDFVRQTMPFLAGAFPSHQAYAEAGVERILEEHRNQIRLLEANWLESTLFLNRGDRFEARVLPPEAQLAPAFAVCVTDFDGDGAEDVFLSQNFFAVEPETSRYDAGRGLWLRGNGAGDLQPVAGQESGVTVYGEQRAAAVSDFDGDGRVDLLVTQNGAASRLFRNVRARPGLRVRLKGPAGNALGIGAQIRVRHGNRWGPARELHAGAGYWSQNSAIAVLARPTTATTLQVRWPGGEITSTEVASEMSEITVSVPGG